MHPEILAALGSAGHGAQIWIADGNYPLVTRSNPNASRVYLNLAPGQVTMVGKSMCIQTRVAELQDEISHKNGSK